MTLGNGWLERARRWLAAPVEVRLVCEVAADYVAAARYQRGRIETWAARPLAAGAVQPATLSDNIANSAAVQEALEAVVSAVAEGERRCALLVPDLLARVLLLEFESVPSRPDEADALLRWRLKNDLPFDIRHAALTYQVQPGRDGKQEVMAAVSLPNLLRQYEECLERLGLEPGWVTVSTLAALGCLASEGGARLLVKRDRGSLSVAVAEGGRMRLFRNLPIPPGHAQNGEALADKVYPAMIYFQDQWGRPVEEIIVTGPSTERGVLAERLAQEAGCPVRELDVAGFDLPPSPASGAAADHQLVASLGWARGEAA
ncbi:MAG: type IV pilus biogenesis protein PilM [Terriglobia bacterium]